MIHSHRMGSAFTKIFKYYNALQASLRYSITKYNVVQVGLLYSIIKYNALQVGLLYSIIHTMYYSHEYSRWEKWSIHDHTTLQNNKYHWRFRLSMGDCVKIIHSPLKLMHEIWNFSWYIFKINTPYCECAAIVRNLQNKHTILWVCSNSEKSIK